MGSQMADKQNVTAGRVNMFNDIFYAMEDTEGSNRFCGRPLSDSLTLSYHFVFHLSMNWISMPQNKLAYT